MAAKMTQNLNIEQIISGMKHHTKIINTSLEAEYNADYEKIKKN